MKAVMIIYNQAHSSVVMEILDNCSIRGFTKWVDVQGRGSVKGEPHYGTHAWPAKNMAILAVVPEEMLRNKIPVSPATRSGLPCKTSRRLKT